MSEIDELRTHLLTAIDAAAGLDALEACRVHALGKQGQVTALLKSLGAMSPDERLERGPPIQALREAVPAAIATRKSASTSPCPPIPGRPAASTRSAR